MGKNWPFQIIALFPKVTLSVLKNRMVARQTFLPFHGFLKLNWKSLWLSIKLLK